MQLGIIKTKTNISKPFSVVKKAFVDKEGKLLQSLLPPFCKLLHYKGVRRGAIIKISLFGKKCTFKISLFGKKCTFKVVTYSTSNDKLYFNDIIKEGKLLGISFWSHRHKINKLSDNDTVIIDEVTFTSRNRYKDFILHVLFLASFIVRSIQYKIFFFRR